ncbi:MAG: transposase family protein [Christensenellales bacterium]
MQKSRYENLERVWRHGDVMFYPCYVHCRRPRVRCPEHVGSQCAMGEEKQPI